MKIVAVLLCGLLTSGCATYVMNRNMKSYEGKHRDVLIRKWGPPTQEAALSDGGKSLVYISHVSSYSGPSPMNPYAANQGSSGTCRMIFNTDKHDIIQSWAYYGC